MLMPVCRQTPLIKYSFPLFRNSIIARNYTDYINIKMLSGPGEGVFSACFQERKEQKKARRGGGNPSSPGD
jgi:hypothetical protein